MTADAQKRSEIFGTLTTVNVPLPPKTEKERLEREAFKEKFGVYFGRAYTDWAMCPADGGDKIALRSGDLVKVFKTVTDGDVEWQGVVDLEYKRNMVTSETGAQQQAVGGFWIHGLQDDLMPEQWSGMFFKNLPAKLERKGKKTIFGALDPFFETGTEGVLWSLLEYGGKGYDGWHILRKGDVLTVFNRVTDGDIEWQGRLAFDVHKKPQKINWDSAKRVPTHLPAGDWLRMSYDNLPVVITPA